MIHVGKIISDRLVELGWTKAEFARRIKRDRQYVQKIVNRASFPIDELMEYGKELGVDLVGLVKNLEAEEAGLPVSEEAGASFYPKNSAQITVNLTGDVDELNRTIRMLKKFNDVLRLQAI